MTSPILVLRILILFIYVRGETTTALGECKIFLALELFQADDTKVEMKAPERTNRNENG